jgi:hypothetical protein
MAVCHVVKVRPVILPRGFDLFVVLDFHSITMAGTERQRELRRRRHRKQKLVLLHKKSEKASKAEKAVIATKLRKLSPGAEQLIAAWKLG